MAARLAELQGRAAERTLTTIDTIISELNEVRELAKHINNSSATVGASMAKAKVLCFDKPDQHKTVLDPKGDFMPKKILCAVDGSDESDRAAACAVELAKETGATLTFVHVSTVPQDRTAKPSFWDETPPSAVNAKIQARLANGQKIAANHGLADFSSVVLKGNRVSFAIAFYAKEKEFDHIVMGTGVTNDMERLFLGSVATEVVSEAHCPVTIVR